MRQPGIFPFLKLYANPTRTILALLNHREIYAKANDSAFASVVVTGDVGGICPDSVEWQR